MKFSDVWKSVRKVGEEKVAAFYSTGRSHPPSSDVIEPRVDKDDPTRLVVAGFCLHVICYSPGAYEGPSSSRRIPQAQAHTEALELPTGLMRGKGGDCSESGSVLNPASCPGRSVL